MTSVVQYYGTGRRKEAAARVRLLPGAGQVLINGRSVEDYVGGRPGFARLITLPFETAEVTGRFDALITVRGGGVAGQIGAIVHGIARALTQVAPEHRTSLRGEGLLTRDSRVKERKKYGRKRARKRFQFSKR